MVVDSILLLVQEATDDMSAASTPVVADAGTHLPSCPVTTLRLWEHITLIKFLVSRNVSLWQSGVVRLSFSGKDTLTGGLRSYVSAL